MEKATSRWLFLYRGAVQRRCRCCQRRRATRCDQASSARNSGPGRIRNTWPTNEVWAAALMFALDLSNTADVAQGILAHRAAQVRHDAGVLQRQVPQLLVVDALLARDGPGREPAAQAGAGGSHRLADQGKHTQDDVGGQRADG